jgi:quinohemoprotein ethanol dehydrogenase
MLIQRIKHKASIESVSLRILGSARPYPTICSQTVLRIVLALAHKLMLFPTALAHGKKGVCMTDYPNRTLLALIASIPLMTACSSDESSPESAATVPATSASVRPITAERIVNANAEPGNWLSTGRSYDEQRFSPMYQINESNVGELELAWHFDIDTKRAMEATPLVADGVMYVTAAWSVVYALDAVTGEQLWMYDPQVPKSWGTYACCDVPNRGAALWGDKVYVATLDGYLVALDAASGEVAWKTDTIDRKPPFTITGAPRIVKGKVIIGNGGAEYGVRGYVTAYDAETGEQEWRTFMVPGNPADGFESDAMREAAKTWTGEWWKYGGGGTAWDAFAYDSNLDLLYVGVGNGSPWNREIRSPGGGDNLFLASILALDPDNGEYVWHYQTTPGESWDYTATQHMILADLRIDGENRQVLMQAPKNGFFYVIDRTNGELISANPYVAVNWATHVDLDTGRPVEVAGARYEDNHSIIYPNAWGGHNWQPMSFSPLTGLVYIPLIGGPDVFANLEEFNFEDRHLNTGLDNHVVAAVSPEELAEYPTAEVRVSAWDPVKQEEVFRIDSGNGWNAGILSTAGNLIFQGEASGEFAAYRADDGAKLWSTEVRTGIQAAPMTFAVNGEQYISVVGGWGASLGVFTADPTEDPDRDAIGRVLTYKIGGTATLPPATVIARKIPDVAPMVAGPEVVQHGKALYLERCSWCHGFDTAGTGSYPDLKYASATTHSLWNSIVLEGAYFEKGMPAFGDFLNEDDAQAIRAYVLKQAETAFESAEE